MNSTSRSTGERCPFPGCGEVILEVTDTVEPGNAATPGAPGRLRIIVRYRCPAAEYHIDTDWRPLRQF
ncbi:hypothetical protein [Amycolatopsis marina]|nr:hypothetical protein [Amycolatopsis marina]